MAIYRIRQNAVFDPERIEFVARAYEDTLRALNLVDRSDPLTELIAKEIFEAAQRGERDPNRLREVAITSLGLTVAPAVKEDDGDAEADGDAETHPTVLIVEDDDAFAYAASRHFQKLGYSAVVASSSLSALQKLEQQTVDVVITDVRLKEGEPNGVALARMIRNRDLAMPVLLITSYPAMVEREEPLPGQVFVKPVELDVLAGGGEGFTGPILRPKLIGEAAWSAARCAASSSAMSRLYVVHLIPGGLPTPSAGSPPRRRHNLRTRRRARS